MISVWDQNLYRYQEHVVYNGFYCCVFKHSKRFSNSDRKRLSKSNWNVSSLVI